MVVRGHSSFLAFCGCAREQSVSSRMIFPRSTAPPPHTPVAQPYTEVRRTLKLQAIDHVAIGVSSFPRAVRWYGELLNLHKFRVADPMFHNEDIVMLSNEAPNNNNSFGRDFGSGPAVKLALLKIPDVDVNISRREPYIIGRDSERPRVPWNATNVARAMVQTCADHKSVHPKTGPAPAGSIDELVRALRGHFAFSVGSKAEFERFREKLPRELKRLHEESLLEDESIGGSSVERDDSAEGEWVEYQNYGVQESVFFHDPDLNEVEVCFWHE